MKYFYIKVIVRLYSNYCLIVKNQLNIEKYKQNHHLISTIHNNLILTKHK